MKNGSEKTFVKLVDRYMRTGENDGHKLGLELEHFVVDSMGRPIQFPLLSSIIETVGKRTGGEILMIDGHAMGVTYPEYMITMEPACQFEISIAPFENISEIRRVYLEFRKVWDAAFYREGYHLEVGGMMPLVERGVLKIDEINLIPKKRYDHMNRHFLETGKYGKYMMRSSTSTQVSIDYSSEADMVRKVRLISKIAPYLMIMMERKFTQKTPVFEYPHLQRIQAWDHLDPARTGFVPGTFDSDFGYARIAKEIFGRSLCTLTENGETTYVGNESIADILERDGDTENEERIANVMEHVISMFFFHIRVKKYIEIRVADGNEMGKALGFAALIKGLFYSESAMQELEVLFRDIHTADELQEQVLKIEKDGFSAEVYQGLTAGDWCERILDVAIRNLSGEEADYVRAIRRECERKNRGEWATSEVLCS